ncbi:HAT1-interacting factor 1 [Exophiala viscosa]|uniref:HAT1-interacting factor 1 n=1 Tax=Exophiala viscosa TaxID=2486360 RepID=A0AAN6DPB0_9EURO|nr:HAT1-interacting factor 1 [Exophiala viscosa]
MSNLADILENEVIPTAPPTEEKSTQSAHEQLAELTAKATAEYTVKHYSEAAELYSQATELQAEVNGEMALENADLLYSYGKCLFFLGQQTSSVLGGTAASAQLSNTKKKTTSKKRKSTGHANGSTNGAQTGESSKAAGAVAEESVPNVGDVIPEQDVKQEDSTLDTPFFQITGDDENWDESDDEEADQDQEAEGDEEEDDDFATAYELMDLARVLYLKKLDQTQESVLEDSEKGKYVASIDLTPEVKNLKNRVADIYDLQSEVSLEGEKYSDAVTDLKNCLALREELESPESSILAECHYKLSLALEFSSQTQQRDADGNPSGDLEVDWGIRNEAIAQQEKAIECCKLRISKESAALEKMEAGPPKDKAMAQVEDVQDMVGEMDVRLAELRKPPVSVKAETEMKEQISGVLGSLLGSGATDQERKEKLAQVSETANDLTGLVKRKKPKTSGLDSGIGSAASTPAATEASEAGPAASKGKRKVEFVDEVEDGQSDKRTKVEDVV